MHNYLIFGFELCN